MINLCSLLLILTSTSGSAVTVTTTDGETLEGTIRSLNAAQLLLIESAEEGAAKPTNLQSEELLKISFAKKSAKLSPAASAIRVVASSGTQLLANEFTATASAAMVVSELSSNPLEIPRTSLRYVRFGDSSPEHREFWSKLLEDDQQSGDVLVVNKRGGKSLDKLTGVVEKVTADTVFFQWDGDQIPVKRSKVAGIVFYNRRSQAALEPRVIAVLQQGSQIAAQQIELEVDILKLTSLSGLKFEIPISTVRELDFSIGKLAYLSDLKPLAMRWTPLVEIPKSAELLRQQGEPRFDRAFTGKSLSLANHDPTDQTSAVVSYAKGIALRSRTELIYKVPPRMKRFQAIAGINPVTAQQGNVSLQISSGDQVLWQAEINGDQPPQPINIEIVGAKRIRLLVDYGKNLDYGDQLHLANARMTK